VDALTEGEMVTDLTMGVERVAVGREGAVVLVGRSGEEHHHAPFWDCTPVVLHIPRESPADLYGR